MLPNLLDHTAPHTFVIVRAALAAVFSLSLWLLCGSRAIAWLRQRFREPIIGDSATLNALHQAKQATPTMGGLFILAAILTTVVLFGNLHSLYVLAVFVVLVGLGGLGVADDLLKVSRRSPGLSARTKLAGQIVVATAASLLLFWRHAQLSNGLALQLPGVGVLIDAGIWFVPLSAMVIVASSNAVNLTDGLDGLAAGCLLPAVSVLAILAYVAGVATLAGDLNLALIPGVDELAVVSGGTIGALLGFLRFNRHPAGVFMGDTGSLPLGGLLGFLAVAVRQELLLMLIGGVFVVEAASVLIQVGVYKSRRRRVFRCAPLHHHFQFLGWPEPRIVMRFWGASALLAAIGLGIAASEGQWRPDPSLARRASVRADGIGPLSHPERAP